MTLLLTINVIALTAFAWLSAFAIVPACSASRFRYRLWRLRDELVDEVRAQKFVNTDVPKRLIMIVERAIEEASNLSALNILLFRLAGGFASSPFDLKDLVPSDKELITNHLREFDSAIARRALGGTPSGWIALIVLVPTALLTALIDRLSDKTGVGGSV